MGGLGSGNHGMQNTTESSKRLDIRWLRKNGYLDIDHFGSLKWTCGDEPAGDIKYQMFRDKMVLHYRVREYPSTEWESVEQTLYFNRTACNYGGERKWFSCPKCLRRAVILYGERKYFLCRKCYDLPYRSQLQSNIDRVIARKHKLGEEIFEYYKYGDDWLKKKGMHQKTFDKKFKKYSALETRLDAYTEMLFGLAEAN